MFRSAFAVIVAALTLQPVLAQGDAATPGFLLELNALQAAPEGCRVTFLATNALATAIDRAAVEMAVFAQDGGIDRIVTLNFKALSPGKTKVLQFELGELACTSIGRLLINDITACEGDGLAPAACLDSLVTSRRPDIDFGI